MIQSPRFPLTFTKEAGSKLCTQTKKQCLLDKVTTRGVFTDSCFLKGA